MNSYSVKRRKTNDSMCRFMAKYQRISSVSERWERERNVQLQNSFKYISPLFYTGLRKQVLISIHVNFYFHFHFYFHLRFLFLLSFLPIDILMWLSIKRAYRTIKTRSTWSQRFHLQFHAISQNFWRISNSNNQSQVKLSTKHIFLLTVLVLTFLILIACSNTFLNSVWRNYFSIHFLLLTSISLL